MRRRRTSLSIRAATCVVNDDIITKNIFCTQFILIICINYVFKGGRYEGTKVKVKVLLHWNLRSCGWASAHARVLPGCDWSSRGELGGGFRWLWRLLPLHARGFGVRLPPDARSAAYFAHHSSRMRRGWCRPLPIWCWWPNVPIWWWRHVPIWWWRHVLDLLFLDPKLCYFLLNLNLLHTFLLNLSLWIHWVKDNFYGLVLFVIVLTTRVYLSIN